MAARTIPPLSTMYQKVGDLPISSTILTNIIQTQTIDAISTAIGELNSLIDELSSKAIFYYLNNVSFLKTDADEPTNLCIWFYTSPEMSSQLSVLPETGEPSSRGIPVVFDSANEYDRQYIEALLINNVENNVDSSIEYRDGFHLYENEHGTQWKTPIDNHGFGEEYNNAPVNLRLVDWALGNSQLSNWVGTFNKSTKLYMKYIWYYTADGIVHASDVYSQVLPSSTEQTAHAISTNKESLDNVVNTVEWNDDIEGFSFEAFAIEPDRLNAVVGGLDTTEHDCLYLENYSLAKEYRVKFTANSDFTFGRDQVAIAGNGQYIDDFESYGNIAFIAGKTYLVSIQAGMVAILAQK